MNQLLLDLLPKPLPSYDNFVPGINHEALAALPCWQLSPGANTGCYLWGDTGSGKTHLLRASGFAYHDAREDSDLRTLSNEGESATPLAVDNVEALSPEGQECLFHAYNRCRTSQSALLAAGKVAPKDLALREDLRSRLGYGLVYGLYPLSDEEKKQALRCLADLRTLSINEQLMDYLITHAPRDMGSLTALLMALDRYSLEKKRPITLPLLREILYG